MHKNFKGFTIVELLIVIVIISILAAVTIVSYNGVTKNARDKSLLSDIQGVESEIALYATKNSGTYGSALNWNSSVGTNANIEFVPTKGNIIVVTTTTTTYCVKAYNAASHSTTLATAQKSECP